MYTYNSSILERLGLGEKDDQLVLDQNVIRQITWVDCTQPFDKAIDEMIWHGWFA